MATTPKQDNRKPNFQPNALPEAVAYEISFAAQVLDIIVGLQNAKLSDAGNISFGAAINNSFGWELPGDPNTALGALTFRAVPVSLVRNGDEITGITPIGEWADLPVTRKGVHAKTDDNGIVVPDVTQISFWGRHPMPSSDVAEGLPYASLVTVTHRDAYTLVAGTTPAAALFKGQPIRGTLLNGALRTG